MTFKKVLFRDLPVAEAHAVDGVMSSREREEGLVFGERGTGVVAVMKAAATIVLVGPGDRG